MTTAAKQQENHKYYAGVGKRKTSVARIKLFPTDASNGEIIVNEKPLAKYFPWLGWQNEVLEPLHLTKTLGQFNAVVKVLGGGIHSQAQAVRHGIARALVTSDQGLKPVLREHGLMTRDARIKESKKYGLKRARRAPQYTKR